MSVSINPKTIFPIHCVHVFMTYLLYTNFITYYYTQIRTPAYNGWSRDSAVIIATCLRRKLSANLYDMYHCCAYSEELLIMDRGTVRNM